MIPTGSSVPERAERQGPQRSTSDENREPHSLKKRLAAKRFAKYRAAPETAVKKSDVGFVDSGIGGAMAAKKVPGNTQEFASNVCLPIGDKAKAQIITYTAQMVLETLIGQKKSHAVIACNTASTQKAEALDVIDKFIRSQTGPDAAPIYQRGSDRLARLEQLRIEIDRDPGYLAKHVHSVVEPTAESGADTVVKKLGSKDKVCVRIDSTNGTVDSGVYTREMCKQIKDKVEGSNDGPLTGYKSKSADLDKLDGRNNPDNGVTLTNTRLTFERTNPKTGVPETKEVLLQNRGNPKWVPAIEANANKSELKGLVGGSFAKATRLELYESPEDTRGFHTNFHHAFSKVPDLTMLCCTHYPAMREALREVYDDIQVDTEEASRIAPEFLQQDDVVLHMVKGLVTDLDDTAILKTAIDDDTNKNPDGSLGQLHVTSGDPDISSAEKAQSEQVLNIIYHNMRKDIHVGRLDASAGEGYRDMHKEMSYQDAAIGRPGVGSSFKDADKSDGVHSMWRQDKSNADSHKRADAHFVAGIPTTSVAEKKISDALALFSKETGIEGNKTYPPSVRKLYTAISQIGRLGTEGETRGIDIVGLRHDPGANLFSAATKMASIVQHNRENPGDQQRVGIVTGFTVVDADGKKLSGENDGPPGAVILAKSMLDQNTPVTLVVDTGSESALVSALRGAGMVEEDLNDPDLPAQTHSVSNLTLTAGVAVEVVDGPESSRSGTAEANTVEAVGEKLEKTNTKLMITIERPGPSLQNEMSSMIGADISKFNADLSPLFEGEGKRWPTIGIGDGGNEMGTGGAADTVRSARKPDFTPVVNNGEKISARTETDDMILNSVSNNGGVFLAVVFELMLDELKLNAKTDIGRTDPASLRGTVEDYKGIIRGMESENMSLDGVNKVNAMTVDGRTLERQDGVVRQPGQDGATHDDMFDAMLRLVTSDGEVDPVFGMEEAATSERARRQTREEALRALQSTNADDAQEVWERLWN